MYSVNAIELTIYGRFLFKEKLMDIHDKNNRILKGFGIEKNNTLCSYLEIFEKMVIGILLLDNTSNVLYVNDKYSEITGR